MTTGTCYSSVLHGFLVMFFVVDVLFVRIHGIFFPRYHLQAFRHLYVLATEPRVVLPRDVDSGEPCYVPMEITFKVPPKSMLYFVYLLL